MPTRRESKMAVQYGLELSDFEKGDLIELHPATDDWMAGDRFGMVTKVGRKLLHISMDRSGKIKTFLPEFVGAQVADPKPGHDALSVAPNDDPVAFRDVERMPEQDTMTVKDVKEKVFGIKQKRSKPDEHIFNVAGMRVSTRSSKAWKRKLAKKILKEVEKQNGPR
jgi:hypothetical protein